MNYVSALLVLKMKFYADTSVPWEIIARLFLWCKHLLFKTPDQTLVKTHFSWKKNVVGDFYVCNKSEKLFVTVLIFPFLCQELMTFFYGGVCVCASLSDYFSCQEPPCFLAISDKSNVLFYLLSHIIE